MLARAFMDDPVAASREFLKAFAELWVKNTSVSQLPFDHAERLARP